DVLLQQTRYDPFGNVHSQSEIAGHFFGFAGEQRDAETGLVYLRARYYDPAIGRFLQRDSEAGDTKNPVSLNHYTYAAANPASNSDPSGHCVGLQCLAGYPMS